MNGDVKKLLYDMMEKNIDKLMFAHDFKRRRNSSIYTRNYGAAKQKVEMTYFLHPSYQPGALAHFWINIQFLC